MSVNDITQIRVGRFTSGIIGLNALLEEMGDRFDGAASQEVAAFMIAKLGEKNYIPPSAAGEYGRAFVREFRKCRGLPPESAPEEPMGLDVKVLGPGCSQCDQLEMLVMEVLGELQIPAGVEHVRDVAEIARLGVMGVPALLIGGKVVCKGSVPTREKLKKWLSEAGAGAARSS